MSSNHSREVRMRQWFQLFEQCVRNRDFEKGKTLFSPDVIGFGTVLERSLNLTELVDGQWTSIWNQTRDFTFDQDSVQRIGEDTGGLIVVTILWSSLGSSSVDPFPRKGRATIVLTHSTSNETGFEAVHSHFSKTPTGEV